jgi:hypothetical protein
MPVSKGVTHPLCPLIIPGVSSSLKNAEEYGFFILPPVLAVRSLLDITGTPPSWTNTRHCSFVGMVRGSAERVGKKVLLC